MIPDSEPAEQATGDHRAAIERFFAAVDALPDDEYVRNFLSEGTMNVVLAPPLQPESQRSDAA